MHGNSSVIQFLLYYVITSILNCDANFLELDVSKTKEMIIDFRTLSLTPNSIILKDSIVERVSS